MQVYASLAESCEMALKLQHPSAKTHCVRLKNQFTNLFDAEATVKEMLDKHGDVCRQGSYPSQFQRLKEQARLSIKTINQLNAEYYFARDP